MLPEILQIYTYQTQQKLIKLKITKTLTGIQKKMENIKTKINLKYQ